MLLEIQGVEILEEFLLFDLGTTDVVLGYSWLAKLGETKINWGLFKLSWKIGAYWMTIIGDPILSKVQVTLHYMEKVMKQNRVGYLLELTTLFESQGQPEKFMSAQEIQAVMTRYKGVFEMPNSLSPLRNREHAICLQNGYVLVNLRPYRYSFT